MKTLPVWIAVVLVSLFAGVSISAAATPAPGVKPAPPQADLKVPGTYTNGKWKYIHTVRNAGTFSEGHFGSLLYENKPVPRPTRVNDHYQSPWGKMYWWGTKRHAFGAHGWHPMANKGKPMGRLLPVPGSPASRPAKLTDEQIAKLKGLLKDLGAADFQTREAAEAAIKKMGAAALPHVREHLKDKDAEVAERAGRIARYLEDLLPLRPSKVTATLSQDKKKYKVGERMRLTLTFTNRGSRSVLLTGGGWPLPWHAATDYVLKGPDGKRIKPTAINGPVGMTFAAMPPIAVAPNMPLRLPIHVNILKELARGSGQDKDAKAKPTPLAYLRTQAREYCFALPKAGKYTLQFRMVGKAAGGKPEPAPQIVPMQQGGQAQPLGPVGVRAQAFVFRPGPRLVPTADAKPLVGTIESNTVTFEVVK